MKRPVFDPGWPESVQEIYHNDLREMWDPDVERHYYNLYQNQLRLYREIVKRLAPRRILDIGCAQATLALLLAEAGHEVTAVDIRPEFLEYARSRYERGAIEFRCANIQEAPDLGSFDLVFANQIVEHVVYPVEFLQRVGEYVRPGGYLVLTTPNQQYVPSGLPSYGELGDPAQHAHRQFSAGGADHFFAYTLEELGGFVSTAGLELVEGGFFESPWISGHMKVRYLHGVLPAVVLRTADRVTLAVAGRRLAHHLLVIARRPTAGPLRG